MTRQEVLDARDRAALGLLGRSGVGYVYPLDQFTPTQMETIKRMMLTDSDTEAMVKVALQFAFQHPSALKKYIAEQAALEPHNRDFIVRR